MSHNFKYANVNSVGTVGVGGTAVLQGNAGKIENRQNINATNPTRKETRFPFHYHVSFRVCPTVKSSHRAKIGSRGMYGSCR
jgi:hypothetical protein